jgi:hypothetical protein
MSETFKFTEESEVAFDPTEVNDVHLNDLSFVLDINVEDGEVTSCRVDLHELVQAMVLYSSMEEFRYGWRRAKK